MPGAKTENEKTTEAAETQPDPDAPLTPAEIDEYRIAARRWRTSGHPENAARLEEAIRNNVHAPSNMLAFGELQPEKEVFRPLSEIVIPQRTGKSATVKAWRDFILETTNIEPEVVERMNREDCIVLAESRGIIPKVRDEGGDGE